MFSTASSAAGDSSPELIRRTSFGALYRAGGLAIKVRHGADELRPEFETLAALHDRGIPVPRPLTLREGTPAALTMEWLDGVRLSAESPTAAKSLGQVLRAVHGDSVGRTRVGDTTALFSAWLSKELPWWRRERLLTGRQILAAFRLLHRARDSLSVRPQHFGHRDLQPNHVLVGERTQELSGIVDWGDARIIDPIEDIAIVSMWDPAIADLVLDGYGSDRLREDGVTVLPLLWVVTHLRSARWTRRHGDHSHAAHHLARARAMLDRS